MKLGFTVLQRPFAYIHYLLTYSVRLFDVIKLARTALDADVEVVGCKGRDYVSGNRNS